MSTAATVVLCVCALISTQEVSAAGCRFIDPPPNSSVRMDGDIAVVHCNETTEAWLLICRDEEWVGQLGTCPGPVIEGPGCPFIDPPPNAWVRTDGGQTEVHCHETEQSWNLTCNGTEWIGDFGTCPAPTTEGPGCPYIDPPPNTWVLTVGGQKEVHCTETDQSWNLTCNGTEWIGDFGTCPAPTTEGPSCPLIDPPSNAWIRFDGGQAVVHCTETDQSWHLTCRGTEWIGDFGTCPAPTTEAPRCTGGRVWANCGTCDRTCETEARGGVSCAAGCLRKCQCPRNRPIWHGGRCIQRNQCPGRTPRCTGGRVWTNCGTCDRTCETEARGGVSCAAGCLRKCQCPRNRPVWHGGRCIQQNQCPGRTPRCTGGRVWANCGTCDRTCETEARGGVPCAAGCLRKCQCPRNRPIWHGGRCIQRNQCPGRTCRGGRVFNDCGRACTPTCYRPNPSCSRQCVRRCECPRSRPLWHRGRCVPRSGCRSF